MHEDVAPVDALLRGYPLEPEIRYRDEHDQIHIQKPSPPAPRQTSAQGCGARFPRIQERRELEKQTVKNRLRAGNKPA
jgi:uncharacterized Zn-finger protein